MYKSHRMCRKYFCITSRDWNIKSFRYRSGQKESLNPRNRREILWTRFTRYVSISNCQIYEVCCQFCSITWTYDKKIMPDLTSESLGEMSEIERDIHLGFMREALAMVPPSWFSLNKTTPFNFLTKHRASSHCKQTKSPSAAFLCTATKS